MGKRYIVQDSQGRIPDCRTDVTVRGRGRGWHRLTCRVDDKMVWTRNVRGEHVVLAALNALAPIIVHW